MKKLSLSCLGKILATMSSFRAKKLLVRNIERGTGHARLRYCPGFEVLEDRSMPSLIASQLLPLMVHKATVDTVSVLAPGLSGSSPTPQQITLTDIISGAPSGGTVSFHVAGAGTISNVPVIGGVARVVYTLPVGTPATAGGTVTATYSGTTGFAGSTSTGAGNGTLTFCLDGASTLLGTPLGSFAVLAGSTVTNTGATLISGDVGVSPGSAVTGLSSVPNPPAPGSVIGTIHSNDADAILAQSQLTTAYTSIASAPAGDFTTLTGDLGGRTLTPGLYRFANSAQLTGTLTLNDENDSNALFEFQIGSTLTTASGSRVQFINGGGDNVYWEVGSSATLGSATVFAGNILAQASITLDSTATIPCGRALARTGAVTLIDNYIDPARGPAIVTAAAATRVNGTSAHLSVQAFDSVGAASLQYTWITLRSPASAVPPTFTANGTTGAHNTTVTVHAAGTYTFQVTITDISGRSVISDVTESFP
jgi:type VI secretion system secreted protein VgrG